jgi:hypothetical protein
MKNGMASPFYLLDPADWLSVQQMVIGREKAMIEESASLSASSVLVLSVRTPARLPISSLYALVSGTSSWSLTSYVISATTQGMVVKSAKLCRIATKHVRLGSMTHRRI